MKYLTTQQVADLLRVSPRRVRQMADDRNISGVRFGKVLAWDLRDLARFERRPAGRPRKRGVSK
jgi:excisionase family DNA binding protein